MSSSALNSTEAVVRLLFTCVAVPLIASPVLADENINPNINLKNGQNPKDMNGLPKIIQDSNGKGDLGGALQDLLWTKNGPCTRHLYNKSGYEWVVVPNGTLKDHGMCDVDAVHPDPCRATPGTAIELNYPDLQGRTEEIEIRAYIRDFKTGKPAPNSVVYDQQFQIERELTGTCVKIKHDGSTGNIAVNDPAGGDIATCGQASYPCSNMRIREPTFDELSTEGMKGLPVYCQDGATISMEEWQKTACNQHGGLKKKGVGW